MHMLYTETSNIKLLMVLVVFTLFKIHFCTVLAAAAVVVAAPAAPAPAPAPAPDAGHYLFVMHRIQN